MGICCKQQRHLSPMSNAMHVGRGHPSAGKKNYRVSGLVQVVEVLSLTICIVIYES